MMVHHICTTAAKDEVGMTLEQVISLHVLEISDDPTQHGEGKPCKPKPAWEHPFPSLPHSPALPRPSRFQSCFACHLSALPGAALWTSSSAQQPCHRHRPPIAAGTPLHHHVPHPKMALKPRNLSFCSTCAVICTSSKEDLGRSSNKASSASKVG